MVLGYWGVTLGELGTNDGAAAVELQALGVGSRSHLRGQSDNH